MEISKIRNKNHIKYNFINIYRNINKNKTLPLSDWQRLKSDNTLLTRGKEKRHEYTVGEN